MPKIKENGDGKVKLTTTLITTSMGKIRIKRLKREVEITLTSKVRYQHYSAVLKFKAQGLSITTACIRVGLPRSKFYYWHKRVQNILKLTQPGSHISVKHFREISSKPRFSPKQIPPEFEKYIIDLRKKTNQGAEFIQYQLITRHGINLSITGIYKVLKRLNMIKPRKYHQKKVFTIIKRIYQPGEKIQVDTKYVKTARGKTFYQYSAIDMATGIIFKYLYENIGPDESCDFLRKLVNFYQFKIEKIQTDNGIEYTWRLNPEIKQIHHFTLQCKLMGLSHVLIPPASPTYNSKVERTHRIDKEELWNKKRFYRIKSMKKALKTYVHNFNQSRKTPSKNWLSPIEYANTKFGLKITSLRFPVQKV